MAAEFAHKINYPVVRRRGPAPRAPIQQQSSMIPQANGKMPQSIDDYISQNKIMMFSKSYCPFCQRAKQLLRSKGYQFFALELDQMPDGAKLQQLLKARTGQSTVPNIFVGGVHVGGFDDTSAKVASGQFKKLYEQAMGGGV